MSLQKKIIISFLISSAIIAILAVSAYISFIEMRKEIRYLELSDTLRSKSLLLRRHEKNFFLYGDLEEIKNVYNYLTELDAILKQNSHIDKTGKLANLHEKTEEYKKRFNTIENIVWDFQRDFSMLKPSLRLHPRLFLLVESTFLERPKINADLLVDLLSLRPDHSTVRNLHALDSEISALRKTGEEILFISQELDRTARTNVEEAISFSQSAVLILFPLFLLVGLATLFVIGQSVVKRLKILTMAVEKAGMGDFSFLTENTKAVEAGRLMKKFMYKGNTAAVQDEVGKLIKAFIKMENDLSARDGEIKKKNEELLQSRKLASIGTLASGVAHELNNPLNNIYLAAQILSRESGDHGCSPIVRDTVKDIFSQTLRVKRIVSDLLEFAREKAPELGPVDTINIVREVLDQMTQSGELHDVRYEISSQESVKIIGDRHLLQQVFINLFANAVDAMNRRGLISIDFSVLPETVEITISDTGKGILKEDITRIFDPFFTTKEKGTGLGLAIVYSIIKKHNGKIEVSSETDKGTTFTITLPREL